MRLLVHTHACMHVHADMCMQHALKGASVQLLTSIALAFDVQGASWPSGTAVAGAATTVVLPLQVPSPPQRCPHTAHGCLLHVLADGF